jgi:hypothetical protein
MLIKAIYSTLMLAADQYSIGREIYKHSLLVLLVVVVVVVLVLSLLLLSLSLSLSLFMYAYVLLWGTFLRVRVVVAANQRSWKYAPADHGSMPP